MLRSMTGFGAAERGTPAGQVRVELRTINHRYLHVNTKLSNALARHDAELREGLRRWFVRGAVTLSARLEAEDGAPLAMRPVRLDEARVAAYLAALRELGTRFGVAGEPDLALLTRHNDIFLRDDADEPPVELPVAELLAALDEAAAQAVRMRDEEGQRLQADLEGRLRAIESALERIAEQAPERLLAERDRLRQAVAELSGGMAVDEQRLAQEIAILAERWDINEELVRFRSHIELFRELVAAEAAEPVGKRLGFLVQEMHREANTTGSKANSAGIAHHVVAIKDEIERLREQVENVE